MIVAFAGAVIVLAYVTLITVITIGWYKTKSYQNIPGDHLVTISVIIAARNEAGTLPGLLGNLKRQDYPQNRVEIIVINDHSTDNTRDVLKEMKERLHFDNLLIVNHQADDDPAGKKACISKAIREATGELILTTDADCRMGPSWVSAIAGYYATYHPKMILGPVELSPVKSIFGKLQSLEFMSLIASAAGSVRCRMPILANGANLAYEREAFLKIQGFGGNLDYASGDDMFLMLAIKKQYGAGPIHFLKSMDSVVSTLPEESFPGFMNQRLRWVSKSRGYTDPAVIASALAVFLINLLILVSGVFVIFEPRYLTGFILVILIKILIDIPVFWGISSFFKKRNLLVLLPLLEILNCFYTVLIGIAGNFGSFNWKDRKLGKVNYKKD